MKLMKKQKKVIIQYTVAIVIILIGLITGSIKKEEILNIFQNQQKQEIDGKYLITEVVDGDTYKIHYEGK